MKVTLLLIFIFTVTACGRIEKSGNRLSEKRVFNPLVIAPVEKAQLTNICNALAAKVQILAQATTQNVTFAVSRRDCDTENGFAPGVPAPVTATIVVNHPEYKLRRSDNGNPFIYPEEETPTSGIMRTICTNLDAATNPRKLENGNTLWVTTTNISTTDCNPKANEVCLLVETGIPNGINFDITTREWMKFQMDPGLPKYGFVTERRTLSSALCGLNQTSQTQAILTE